MSPRTGRPLSDNPKSARIEMRVTPQEKQQIMKFAKEHKLGLLDLLNIGIETVKKKQL